MDQGLYYNAYYVPHILYHNKIVAIYQTTISFTLILLCQICIHP